MKILLVLLSLFMGSQAVAWTDDYVSVFKPEKRNNIEEFQREIKEDFFQIRSMMNLKKDSIIGLAEETPGLENTASTSEI